jgi:hypothetical protein
VTQAQTSAARVRTTDTSAHPGAGFRLEAVSWDVSPEPPDEDERAALLAVAKHALADEDESAWWRSGFDDLGGGPAPEQTWSGAGVVEP